MKTTTSILIVMMVMSGCIGDVPDNIVWNIENYGNGTCSYWAHPKIHMTAPCGIYQIGDIVYITKKR